MELPLTSQQKFIKEINLSLPATGGQEQKGRGGRHLLMDSTTVRAHQHAAGAPKKRR
jgi:hypothetical protein